MKDGKDADLVIEAVPEKLDIIRSVFKQLDEIMQPNAILATNTSSLSLAAISSATSRPDRVVGLHFFSPVPIMKLIVIEQSINTSKEVKIIVKEYAMMIIIV